MTVIVQQQHETKIYANADGGITIAQSNSHTGIENFIHIQSIHVPEFVRALRMAKKEIEEAV